MDVTKVKRMVGQCEDDAPLAEIERAVRERRKLIAKRKFEAKQAAAWARVKDAKRGDVLYVHATAAVATSFGYGDRVEVYAVQPRAKRLWITHPLRKGKPPTFLRPREIALYDLRAEEPPPNAAVRERVALYRDVMGGLRP